MRKHQALALLAAAASLQPGAHARASHLITQIDNYAPYMAVVGMNVLKNAWRSPRPPQLTASLDEWVHYYTECPNLIPPPLSSPQNAPNAIPSRDLINGHLIFMRANPPPLPGSRNPTVISIFKATTDLFSIPGLFEDLVLRGQYPRAHIENIQPFPQDVRTPIGVHHVACWYARCGIRADSVLSVERVCRRTRNLRHKRGLDDESPWQEFPRTAADFPAVPHFTLMPPSLQSGPPPPTATTGGQ